MIFHLGRSPPLVHLLFDGMYNSVLEIQTLLFVLPPATSKACSIHLRKRTCGFFNLFPAAGQKTSAAVEPSRSCQVGQGPQVFALRVVPGPERG